MKKANEAVSNKARNLFFYQLGVGAVLAVAFYLYKDAIAAASALFGVFTSLLSAYLLSSGVKKAESNAIDNPRQSMGVLYFGAVQRFILVVVLFVAGLKFLGLDAVAMGSGFIVAQLGFVFLFKGLSKIG